MAVIDPNDVAEVRDLKLGGRCQDLGPGRVLVLGRREDLRGPSIAFRDYVRERSAGMWAGV